MWPVCIYSPGGKKFQPIPSFSFFQIFKRENTQMRLVGSNIKWPLKWHKLTLGWLSLETKCVLGISTGGKDQIKQHSDFPLALFRREIALLLQRRNSWAGDTAPQSREAQVVWAKATLMVEARLNTTVLGDGFDSLTLTEIRNQCHWCQKRHLRKNILLSSRTFCEGQGYHSLQIHINDGSVPRLSLLN